MIDYNAHINLNPDSKVTAKPSRRIPLVLKHRVKEKLDNLERLRIIKKIDNSSCYVSNLVVLEKPDRSVRSSLDLHDLNLATKRIPHLILSIEDAAAVLCKKILVYFIRIKRWFVPYGVR